MENQKATKTNVAMDIISDRNTAKYVRENFMCKECTVFVPKVEQIPTGRSRTTSVVVCHCGASVDEHRNSEKLAVTSEAWDATKCIQKMPTNAFGRLRFSSFDFASSQSPRYLRLADDTDPQLALDLMKDYWRLMEDGIDKPQLIISVVGGGRMFKLADSVQKKVFNRELMRAVATTNGWLLTSGLDVGVAHAVGDSTREAQSFVWRSDDGKFKNRICCIGIVPWGGVFGGNRLINSDPERINELNYPVFAAGAQWRFKKRLPLNPYHTHFLLVDDGFRNRERGAAQFRAKLERQITLPVDNGGLAIPVVQILIDGAANALEVVARSVMEGVPVLVCEGTGRAADLLAQVCRIYGRICKTADEMERNSKIEAFKYSLRERVVTWLYADHLPIDAEERYDRCVQDIMQICEKRQMVTIFNVKQGTALDTAILATLMDRTQTERSSQLHLALKWNRIDVAKAKIFGSSAPAESALDLWPYFMEALKTNKPEFVRLFIEYGLDVKGSMTVRRLTDLYADTIGPQTLLCRLVHTDNRRIRQQPLSLLDVYKVIKEATRGFDNPLYSAETHNDGLLDTAFDDPFDELFIWAVFLHNDVLATRFWEQSEQPLLTGIIGTVICTFLATHARNLTGPLKAQLLAMKSKLEQLAIGLAEKAFDTDREQTMLLLHRRWRRYANFTCLELAAMAKDEVFLSSEPCQFAIWNTWTRGFEASGLAIAVSAFTVFPVLLLIRFDDESSPSDLHGSALSLAKAVSTPRTTNVSLVPEIVDGGVVSKNGGNGRRFWFNGSTESLDFMSPFNAGLSAGRKYITFYTSPSVKFACHTLSYIMYLLLYAYVILFAFRVEPTKSEIILHLWTFTLLCEQIRIVITYSGVSFKERFVDWWIHSSMAAWNRLDFLMLFIYLVAVLLRFSRATFKYARVLLALNCITCLFRLFKIYFVNSYLGPKVVMLKRMAFDLAMFLLVLVIILLSYTVVSHALLFPHKEFYTGVFWNLLYHGVWVLFGEVQSELERAMAPICASPPVNGSEAECETQSLPPPILLAAYCFFGNILLVNMLIATFTNVFEEVQKNSEHLWKYLMYFVVKEFNEKPSLPPPFIIIEHIFLLLNHCRRYRFFGGKPGADMVWGRVLTEKNYRFLSVFEKTIRSDLVEQKRNDDGKQVENLLPDIHSKMHRIYGLLKSVKADISVAQHGPRRKPKGAFMPRISQFAAKIRNMGPGEVSSRGGRLPPTGQFVPDSIGTTDTNLDDMPLIDDDFDFPAGESVDDYFDEEEDDAQGGREILEHFS